MQKWMFSFHHEFHWSFIFLEPLPISIVWSFVHLHRNNREWWLSIEPRMMNLDERKQLSVKENDKNQMQKCQGRLNEVTWRVGGEEWLWVSEQMKSYWGCFKTKINSIRTQCRSYMWSFEWLHSHKSEFETDKLISSWIAIIQEQINNGNIRFILL